VGQVYAEKGTGRSRIALSPTGRRLPIVAARTAAPNARAEAAAPNTDALLELDEQGFYEVRDAAGGGATGTALAVNLDTSESDLSPLDPQELVAAVTGRARGNDSTVGDDVEVRPADLERRQAIWWYLLLAGVVILAAETLLSNRLSRAAT
jgi:hypothetical protein